MSVEVKRYRRRPTEITAIRYGGTDGKWYPSSSSDIAAFMLDKTQGTTLTIHEVMKVVVPAGVWRPEDGFASLKIYDSVAHHDWLPLAEGDYVIKGVNGEFYPCKPDVFEKTYKDLEVKDEPQPQEEIDAVADVLEQMDGMDLEHVAIAAIKTLDELRSGYVTEPQV